MIPLPPKTYRSRHAPRCAAMCSVHDPRGTRCTSPGVYIIDRVPLCWLHALAYLNDARPTPLVVVKGSGVAASPHHERGNQCPR